MSANLATLIAHPPMDGRDKPDTVQFSVGFRHPASQRLHVALADGFIADDANLKWSRIPENAAIPVSFQISAGDAEALARQLVRLGFAADLIQKCAEGSAYIMPAARYPIAPIVEFGRVCVIDGAQQVHTYPHAALFHFTDADHLRLLIDARQVGVASLFAEPKL